jgi:DNA-binding NarL/FixJ family response regulator
LKACSLAQSPVGATPASGGIAGFFPNAPLPGLSERQMAILHGLCRGEPNKIIGRALSLPTVKVHVREIMRKLSVPNRTRSPSWFPGWAPPFSTSRAHDTLREGWRSVELPDAER